MSNKTTNSEKEFLSREYTVNIRVIHFHRCRKKNVVIIHTHVQGEQKKNLFFFVLL